MATTGLEKFEDADEPFDWKVEGEDGEIKVSSIGDDIFDDIELEWKKRSELGYEDIMTSKDFHLLEWKTPEKTSAFFI